MPSGIFFSSSRAAAQSRPPHRASGATGRASPKSCAAQNHSRTGTCAKLSRVTVSGLFLNCDECGLQFKHVGRPSADPHTLAVSPQREANVAYANAATPVWPGAAARPYSYRADLGRLREFEG